MSHGPKDVSVLERKETARGENELESRKEEIFLTWMGGLGNRRSYRGSKKEIGGSYLW